MRQQLSFAWKALPRPGLEIIRELQEFDTDIPVRGIANRLAERHSEDFGRKITHALVGYLVRKKLGLKTQRRETGYVIGSGEKSKLEVLLEKYGLRPGI